MRGDDACPRLDRFAPLGIVGDYAPSPRPLSCHNTPQVRASVIWLAYTPLPGG